MKKLIYSCLAGLLLTVAFVLLAVVVDSQTTNLVVPEIKYTQQAKDFITFRDAWNDSYARYRLDDLHNRLKGKTVAWEGLVGSIDHTGKAFDLYPRLSVQRPNFHAYIVLPKRQGYVPSTLSPFMSHVRIKGRVSSVTVLGVIIEVTEIKQL